MAATYSTLKDRFLRRVRADKASPAVSDLNNLADESIQAFIQEAQPEVIKLLAMRNYAETARIDTGHVQALVEYNASVTLDSGSGSLPSDYLLAAAVRAGSDERNCLLYFDPAMFSKWDSGNWLSTPDANWPVALVTDGALKVKPASLTSAKIDYLKEHPDIDSDQPSLWSNLGDEICIELAVAKYFDYRKLTDRAALARDKAARLAA